MTVLQPIGDAIGNAMLQRPACDFPGAMSMEIDTRLCAPPAPPQCWSPYGVTWMKPAPGGPIVYGPGGSFVAPAPQLPAGSRGPVVQTTGVAMPGPGGDWNGNGATAELLANAGMSTAGRNWMWLLVAAGAVTWALTRKPRKSRRN